LNRDSFDQSLLLMEDCVEFLLDCVLKTSKGMERDLQCSLSDATDTAKKRVVSFSRAHLEIQIQVSMELLELCENRKRRRLSSAGTCAILQRTPGISLSSRKGERNYSRPVMPFLFVIVRPSSFGIVLKVEFFSTATLSGFAHSSSSAQVGSAMSEIFSLVAEVLQSPEMLHFDCSLTRFVADVVSIDNQSASWVLKAVKALVPTTSRLSSEVLRILSKYHLSGEALRYLTELLRHDLVWGADSLLEHPASECSLQGSYAALLLKEYAALMIRERYSFVKTLLFSFSIITAAPSHRPPHSSDHDPELSQVCLVAL
jgi:hypothetical protein